MCIRDRVTAPIDKDIITEVQAIKDYHTVKTMSREDAEKAGLYQVCLLYTSVSKLKLWNTTGKYLTVELPAAKE